MTWKACLEISSGVKDRDAVTFNVNIFCNDVSGVLRFFVLCLNGVQLTVTLGRASAILTVHMQPRCLTAFANANSHTIMVAQYSS